MTLNCVHDDPGYGDPRYGRLAGHARCGVETQAVLMSVFRTLGQRRHNPVSAVVDAVRTYLKTGEPPPLPGRITENG